jgi:hypothetical protein
VPSPRGGHEARTVELAAIVGTDRVDGRSDLPPVAGGFAEHDLAPVPDHVACGGTMPTWFAPTTTTRPRPVAGLQRLNTGTTVAVTTATWPTQRTRSHRPIPSTTRKAASTLGRIGRAENAATVPPGGTGKSRFLDAIADPPTDADRRDRPAVGSVRIY